MDEWPEVMTGRMAAKILGVSTQRVAQLAKRGKLDYSPRGDRRGITAASVRARLAENPSRTRKKPPEDTWKGRRQIRLSAAREQRIEQARVACGSRQLLTYAEAMVRLNVTRRSLRMMLADGRIARVDVFGNLKRVTVESVEWFNSAL